MIVVITLLNNVLVMQERREEVLEHLKANNTSADWLLLIAACLHREPILRPTAPELLHKMSQLWDRRRVPTWAGLLEEAREDCRQFEQRRADLPLDAHERRMGPAHWLEAAQCLVA
jgi:hypothetical protein